MKETICIIISGIVTELVYLLGGWDVSLQCLVVAIALDYVSEIIKAFHTKTLSSRQGILGLFKKVAYLIVVMLAVLIDRVTGNSGAIRTLVIYYFVANEGLSIIENLSVTNIPIPKVIKKALKALKKEGA